MPLRRGWTTGACAAAATRAACEALLTGSFPDPVSIRLPRGQRPEFALAHQSRTADSATAGIIKDAGDDPDVTHGAMVIATVRRGALNTGICFRAGEGVGTVTRPGLPIPAGEPAINPVPRQLMREAVQAVTSEHGGPADIEIEIAIPGGVEMARHTLNGRLGIEGGLSVLGTTGIVVPFSCSAWIASIHRGVDVARAANVAHIAAATGSTSEAAVKRYLGLPDVALIDMGDFAGGLLKYLRQHPVSRITIAGGFAKICKLAQGHMDLHSGRSQVDFAWLAECIGELGGGHALCEACGNANTAMQVLELVQAENMPLADRIATRAQQAAQAICGGGQNIDVLIFDRQGKLAGRSDG